MKIARRHSDGDLTDTQARDILRGLDRRMWLELNSSWINYFLLEMLIDEYPQAKFIFTIRDCYSWLDSILNQLLGREHGEYEYQFQRWYGDSMTREAHKDGEEVIEKTVVCFSVLLLKLVTSLARETITSTTAITISPVKQVTIWALITLMISYTQ